MARTRILGRVGWRVTEVGLGCWQYGGALQLDGKPDGWTGVTDEESIATIQRAVEIGVNFFDTADMYGRGHSEKLLGRALKPFRDQVLIASKVGFGQDEHGNRTFNESSDYIIQACDQSLQRLQTDHIDLYQCHLWRTERWTEFVAAFTKLQKQGKIRLFGISTNDFDMVQRFDESRQLGTVQSNYNLLDRNAEREILPYCRSRGIGFIARGPLAMGKLTGKYSPDALFDPRDIRTRWTETTEARDEFERDLQIVARLKPIADKGGFTLAQLAIKFVLAHVAVSVVIAGAKDRRQLEQNMATSVMPPLTSEERLAIVDALTDFSRA